MAMNNINPMEKASKARTPAAMLQIKSRSIRTIGRRLTGGKVRIKTKVKVTKETRKLRRKTPASDDSTARRELRKKTRTVQSTHPANPAAIHSSRRAAIFMASVFIYLGTAQRDAERRAARGARYETETESARPLQQKLAALWHPLIGDILCLDEPARLLARAKAPSDAMAKQTILGHRKLVMKPIAKTRAARLAA